MTTLKKLQIRGIRSFDPSSPQPQMIEFFTPVTLIVGQNGCGKTTIIEALKYVITNSFPPGTEGGRHFIHDPKLGSGYEVLGQVSLELVTLDGSSVNTVRRMKCTQKAHAKKATFSSLEGTVRISRPNGKTVEMTSKCADLKVEMCRLMGVSDSILNYVIFCHQEDSCWPLDEGKKVKERFDAIFNTTGYMHALTLLDKKDKELAGKISVERGQLKYAEANMEIVRKKRRELERLEVDLAAQADSEKKYEEDRERLGLQLKAIEEVEKEFSKHTSAVAVSRAKVESEEKAIQDLRENIKEEFDGDVEELQEVIRSFTREGRKKQSEIEKKSGQLTSKERDLTQLRRKQQEYLVEEGKFKQAEELNQQRLKSLKSLGTQITAQVRKLKEHFTQESLNLSSAVDSFLEIASHDDDHDLPPDAILKALTAAVRGKDSEYQKVKAALDQEERKHQNRIDQLRSQQSSLETEIGLKKDQITENRKTVEDLKHRLIQIEGSSDHLAILDDDERTFTAKIEQIENSGVIVKCEEEIAALADEVQGLEEKLSDVQEQVQLLMNDKRLTDQIEIWQRQKTSKQNECSEIMRRIDDQLQEILGSVPSQDLSHALETKMKELRSEMTVKNKEIQKKQREQSTLSAELTQVKRNLQRKRQELEDWREQISELVEDASDFQECYEKVKSELERAQNENATNDAAQYLYKKYVRQLSTKPCCPLCKRDFNARTEADALKRNLEKKVEDWLQNQPTLRSNLEKLKQKFQSYSELKPSFEEKSKLEKDDIPELESCEKDLKVKLESVQEEVERLEETLAFLNGTYAEAQSLVKEVALHERNLKEVKECEGKIAQLERKRDPKAKESTMTLEDARNEQESLQGTLKAKRLEKESKEKLRSRKKDELDSYRTQRNTIQEQKLQITAEMQNREALETQKRELEESSKSLQDLISSLTAQIPTIKSQITSAEKAKTEFLHEKDLKLNQIRSEKDSFQQQASKVTELKKQLEEFESKKFKFSDDKKKIAECRSAVQNLEGEIQTLRDAVDQLKTQVAAHEVKERELNDNLKLKQRLLDLEKVRAELASKEKLLKDAEKRGGTVGSQKRDLNRQYDRVNAKLNESKGKSSQLREGIRSINTELNTDYKDAEVDYRERLVRHTVYDRAQIDIRKFKKALDHAIMTFHKMRMESINRSLKRYWQQVYKGNDIDYIQIRTDDQQAEGQEVKLATGTSRRSYSYRVVMIKRGVELDMRGRCSAGQKVLASIIIRISLAEAFSAKCGIIALDEPTTNLDEENIRSLADTLNLLSQRMSKHRTFQLILITHDQPFMQRLLENSQVDKFYKVTRNINGFSQITQNLK